MTTTTTTTTITITNNNIRSVHECIVHTSNVTPTPTKIDTVLINLAKAKRLNVDDFALCFVIV